MRSYPDPFYDAVAAVHQQLGGTTAKPVAELAAANGVPVTTASTGSGRPAVGASCHPAGPEMPVDRS